MIKNNVIQSHKKSVYYKNCIYIWHKYFRLFIVIVWGLFTFNNLKPIITDAKEVETKQYRPPKHGVKRKTVRIPGGSRGSQCQNSNYPITLLIPEDHVATTISSHPELHWYLKNNSYPIRFTLTEPGQINPIYVKNLEIKKPGLVKLKLPKSVTPLESEKLYKWTVSIICNPLSPSENILAKGWIMKVEQPIFNQEVDCVKKYANAGIWYDALSCPSIFGTEYNKLLKQIGLSNLSMF